jgi:hypothetical protein
MAEVNTPFLPADFAQTDTGAGSSYSTGDLRRGYALGDSFTELKLDVDPFFRIMTMMRKKPVAETIFKSTQSRSQLHKRYVYVVGWKLWDGTGSAPTSGYTENSSTISTLTPQTQGSTFALKVGCDYKTSGAIQNIYGQSNGAIAVGATGTTPNFLIRNDLLKINTKSAATGVYDVSDWMVVKILDVQISSTYAYIGVRVIRPIKTSTNYYLTSFTTASAPISATYTYSTAVIGGSAQSLEVMRSYIVGNSHNMASGYPGTWNTTPFSTSYSMTEITKTSLQIAGSTLATEYKLVPNERARLWAEKILEHKFNLAHKMYWSTLYKEDDGTQHTQGLVDYALNYGNKFSITYTSTTKDSFLEDMSTFSDPRYNNTANMLFLVSTPTWNWMHKLGGYALNNLKLAGGYASGYGSVATFDFAQKSSLFGTDISTFSTLYGPMNVIRDIHLDGSDVKMLGINMDYVLYRPLAGNGINRDTSIYLGVKTIQNSGEDVVVDLIQTEAALEITMPEAHAVWT